MVRKQRLVCRNTQFACNLIVLNSAKAYLIIYILEKESMGNMILCSLSWRM